MQKNNSEKHIKYFNLHIPDKLFRKFRFVYSSSSFVMQVLISSLKEFRSSHALTQKCQECTGPSKFWRFFLKIQFNVRLKYFLFVFLVTFFR